MRTEYLAQCASYATLAEAINEGIYLVPEMNRDQMSEAIVGPIRKVGAEITAPLVDRLLNDAAGQPDALPLKRGQRQCGLGNRRDRRTQAAEFAQIARASIGIEGFRQFSAPPSR